MKKLIYLLLIIAFVSCNSKKEIHCYKVHQKNNTKTTDDDWLFYYVMYLNSTGNDCYVYTSSAPVNNFSGVSWQSSSISPIADVPAVDVQEQAAIDVQASDLPADVVSDMDASTDVGTDMSTDAGSDASGDAGGDSGGDGGGDGGGGGE